MELGEVKEILRKRGFTIDEDLREEVDDVTFEGYNGDAEGKFVEICYSSYEVDSIFISNPYYDFCSDDSDRKGVNIGKRYGSDLSEELFVYCLDIQDNPILHTINFCKIYSKFLEWFDKELMPILKHLDMIDEELEYTESIDGCFPLQLEFYYENSEERDLYIDVSINPLTMKIKILVGGEDMSCLMGEPSDVILAAIEEYMEGFKKC